MDSGTPYGIVFEVQDASPRPLRSRWYLWGLPDLSPSECKIVEAANALMTGSLLFLFVTTATATSSLMAHPTELLDDLTAPAMLADPWICTLRDNARCRGCICINVPSEPRP